MKNFVDGGEAILEAIRNLDIDYVISSPGSEWGPVWEALARQQVGGKDGPTYISCQHETLAVTMANGYTMATGRLQAVLLHAGAGLLQGSMGIHGAQLSETPMLVMSGETLTYGEDPDFNPGHQWLTSLSIVGGPNRLLDPIVKWSHQATSPETLYESVMRAGEMARRTPAGPTYLSVPIETMLHEWRRPERLVKVEPAPRTQASDAEVERIAALLLQSDNPLITSESVGRDPEAYAALVELAELLAIPVVDNFVASRANFPKAHPLYQGGNIAPHLDQVDLVLSICARVPWYPPSKRPAKATVVAIDDNPFKTHMVYQNLQADTLLEGDVAASLRKLAEAVRAAGFDAAKVEERRARWSAAHDKLLDDCRSAEAAAREKDGIDPISLCAALTEAMPRDTAYVDETTTHRGAIQGYLGNGEPQTYFRVPSGLGQGLGIALGVKLASPDRPVVSFIGDGAFLYNPVPQSLGVSRDANLPIMIVVVNNRGYAAMRNNQLSYYPDGTGKEHDLYLGHPIDGPEYGEMVKPYGGFGRHVEALDDLPGAIEEGLAAVNDGKTAILNVEVTR